MLLNIIYFIYITEYNALALYPNTIISFISTSNIFSMGLMPFSQHHQDLENRFIFPWYFLHIYHGRVSIQSKWKFPTMHKTWLCGPVNSGLPKYVLEQWTDCILCFKDLLGCDIYTRFICRMYSVFWLCLQLRFYIYRLFAAWFYWIHLPLLTKTLC
jgi:hypothetical protein